MANKGLLRNVPAVTCVPERGRFKLRPEGKFQSMRIRFQPSIRTDAPSRERRSGFFCLLAVMLAAATSAQAGPITFFVSTSSTANAQTSSCGVLCTVSNLASTSYNTNTGANTQFLTGNSTATGSTGLGLTASFDQTTANNGPTTATSYSAADLSSGTLKSMDAGTIGGQGSSVVELFDTLTFTVAGATGSTMTNFGINAALDGSDPDTGISNIDFALVVGQGANGSADAAFSYNTFDPPIVVDELGWTSESVSSATLSNLGFQGVLTGQGATFTDTIDLKLTLSCVSETCDYSHTGMVTLNLPSDVTFTSASGVFLTSQQSGVPEPASGAMTVAGLMLAVGVSVIPRRSKKVKA
jgi:hypothetical protein